MERLVDEINDLIEGGASDLSRIEHTLTDGYARALDLEAERWRIERRLAEIATRLTRSDPTDDRGEVSVLVARRDCANAELVRLRNALGDLRRHAELVRANAA
ncbi:MAG TPA: hypothetical protein VFA05_05945 [Gaiellaceae bacterium]|nr:hypothetical protein [Gaiellaceae bacterium]